MAFLTKSFVSLFFAPALLMILIYFKKMESLFKSKWFYLGVILYAAVSIGYLLTRDFYNPGYIKYLIDHDFLSRYTNVVDSQKEPFDFYLNRLYEERFKWIVLVFPGALLMWFNAMLRPVFVFLSVLFITYFLLLSFSVSKVEWYDLPLYPVLSVFCGYALCVLISKFQSSQNHAYSALALFFIFLLPLYFACRNSYKSEVKPGERKLEILNEYAFKNKNNQSLNGVVFLTNYFDRPLYFYKYRLNAMGLDFKLINSLDNLKESDIVIVAEDSLKNVLLNRYKTVVLDKYRTVLKIKIY